MQCDECGSPLNEAGVCENIDCPEAQAAATKGAGRMTAKAGAAAAVASEPRAFSRSGQVD